LEIQQELQKGSIMKTRKTTWMIFTLALALATSIVHLEARAEQGSGVWRNEASDPNDPRSKAIMVQRKSADVDKHRGELKWDQGLMTDCVLNKICRGCGDPGCGRGCDRGACWNSGCCGCCQPDYICFQSCAPCSSACGEDVVCDVSSFCSEMLDVDPITAPAVRRVRIVNPLTTQATFHITVNGQAYSLEAGKSEEVKVTGSVVIELDRASDNATNR
jgi:hypothetical protein